MKYHRACFLLFSIISVSGCAIHPVQQDVTNIETLKIVNQIRCETRAAIITEVGRLLDQENKSSDEVNRQRIANIYKIFKEDPGGFTDKVAKKILNKNEYIVYSKYINAAIAFEFSLEGLTTNNVSAGLDPLGVFSKGIAKITLMASDNRSRENTRSFIVSDTFQELLKFDDECDRVSLKPDLAYPISGSIGMDELIQTFIALNQGAPIVDSTKSIVDIKNNSPVFADTLKFTTVISGTVNPVVTLGPAAPVGKGLRLLDANFNATASRQDMHQIIVALSLQPDASTPTRTSSVVGPLGALPAKSVLSKRSVKPESAEERAIEAITQQRLNNFYDRFVLPAP